MLAAYLAAQVKIVPAPRGGYELVRNGQPYYVKGAVGSVHLEELAAAGGNSIRAGVQDLDRAQALGLTVLAGLPFGKQRSGFDYSDAARVEAQRRQIRQIVEKYRNHPALLAWAIGNELEIRTTPEQRAVLWKEVNQVAKMIHAIDPNHPVITPVGDAYRRMLSELNQYAPDLDAAGLNSYADMLTLPEDIARQGWRRPYLVTEFGPRGHWQVAKTRWNLPVEDTSTEKAAFYRKSYEHAVAGQPTCLGAYVFHWAQHHEKTHTWYGMFLEDGSRTESVDVMTYLWSGRWPANRSPRIGPRAIAIHAEDDPAAHESFPPGAILHASVDASDPDNDPLRITWDLRRDVSGNPNVGGDREEPVAPIDGAVQSASGSSATFLLPEAEGPYRLFVYVRDGHGNAATANAPLVIEPRHYAAIPPDPDSASFGHGIQRTMTLLATSTPKHRNRVRILFYGQSLTKQEWSRDIAAGLRREFPYADLETANRAIGGYSSQYLIQTTPHDVFAFYPDLIVFHDFGAMDLYEQIIREIRAHTTAEILIQTDRPAWNHVDGIPDDPEKAKSEDAHQRLSAEVLPAIARKYHCELAGLRGPWLAWLAANHRNAADVLMDGAHFTLEGDSLVTELTRRHLRYDPAAPKDEWNDLVRNYETGRDILWENGRLRLEFDGNRVEALAGRDGAYHASEADVLIDGRHPSEIPDLYFITRPSDTFAVDWPAVNRVRAEKPLVLEDWTLRVLEASPDESSLRFEVIGSQTGQDGTGVSSERFVSRSGRVVIEPGDWGVKRAFDLRHIATPPGFEVRWRVLPMFVDTWRAPRIEDPSREYATGLAVGLTNGRHTLELVTKDKTNPPVRAIRVYRPPVR
jgi:hypothetical protein